ncbi:MAG: Trm112 family protein [Pseudomonadota bacterium]
MTDEGDLPSSRAATSPTSPRLLESLVCPATGGRLTFDADRQELVSKSANLAYPIRSGIPIMLIDEARMLDD